MSPRGELVAALDDLKDAREQLLENWKALDTEYVAQAILEALTLMRLAEVKIDNAMRLMRENDEKTGTVLQ